MMSKARFYFELEQREEVEKAPISALETHEDFKKERKIILNLMFLLDATVRLKKTVQAQTYLNSVTLSLDAEETHDLTGAPD